MLKKLAVALFYPGVAEIPYRPEETVCDPEPPGDLEPDVPGNWVLVCEASSVFVGYDYGPPTFDNPGPFPIAIYMPGPVVCRNVWVPA